MPHRSTPLSELGRLRLARCVVEQGWPVARAAERFQVSRTTAQRWAGRYRDQGVAGMADRSSCPHRSPRAHPGADGPQGRPPALQAAAGPGPDRPAGRPGRLHRPLGGTGEPER